VIYVNCDRTPSDLACRVDDRGTAADVWTPVKKQISCLIGASPLADDLRAATGLITDLAARHATQAPTEQWVKMVVWVPAVDLLYPTRRGEPLRDFTVEAESPDTCQELELHIGPDYGAGSRHMLAAYAR
jgi:hypothetical protein